MPGASERKKRLERFFLDKMIDHLGWAPTRVEEGSEPPDFFVEVDDRRYGVEITQILHGETARRGSLVRAQEESDQGFVDELRDAYFTGPSPQAIQASVSLPLNIQSPSLRKLTPQERRAHLDDLKRMALARLRHLPRLAAGGAWNFRVQHRRGGATFRVFCLPSGMGAERLWESTNKHVGWVSSARSDLLQSKVEIKAAGLAKYRPAVDSAVLLIVADRGRASGFFDLEPNVILDPLGFEEVDRKSVV